MSFKSTFLIFPAVIFALSMPVLAQEAVNQETSPPETSLPETAQPQTVTQESANNGQDDAGAKNIALVPDFATCAAAVKLFSQSHNILFAPASSKLTAESAIALKDLVPELEKCPDASLYVAGHTDSDGPEAANMALSVARAEAVNAELIVLGIKDTRLYALGYGETMPIASNNTRAGKAKNRRIVFELVK